MKEKKRINFKTVLGAAWLTLALSLLAFFINSDIPWKETPEILRSAIQKQGTLGPFLYIILYMLRPLTLFPAAIFTAASGLIWGPFPGCLYTIVGENLSASFAFWMGRYFGRHLLEDSKYPLLQGIGSSVREHGFMTVLILRLTYMPFDPVNFGCGLTAMRYREYAAASFIGIIPGAVSFVYFGSSWFEPRNLLIGGAISAVSMAVAYLIRHTTAGSKIVESVKIQNRALT